MKIAIIGGGPGGLTAALESLKRGYEVTLFEKGFIGDDIRCGECLFDSFGLLSKPSMDVATRIDGIIFKIKGEYRRKFKDFERLWMLDRKKWQLSMAKEAIALGLNICEESPVDSKELQVLSKAFDYVIDASGAPSVTSYKYGFFQEYLNECFVGIQHVIQGDFTKYNKALKIGFLPETYGYYWIFPKNDNLANVGVGLQIEEIKKGKDIKTLLHEVLVMENLENLPVEKTVSGILPTKLLGKIVYDNILLVGEAAGLTSPLHGEGIDLACISAQLAVDSIQQGNSVAMEYESKLRNLVDTKWQKEKSIADYWQKISFKEFDNLIHALCTNNKLLFARTTLKSPKLMQSAWQWLRHKA
ncbi:NAD(P)/FAD-dependent oxidoreductase [Pelosinus sp. sgz500959]|uniref:NAD(P)/FAD-dependent oxidoreductase n=1 Tax=Pelosinus sp. sgz500959 TaxID=3242472 RepID=UPI003671899A